jgi:hypothetical protein
MITHSSVSTVSTLASVASLSDQELLDHVPALVARERGSMADVIAHLFEIDRRRLFLGQAYSSLYAYCTGHLRYSEDETTKRVRVARLAGRFPAVLDELRNGTHHLSGLFMLSNHLTEDNSDALLAAARGKSKSELECLLAEWFPRPDAPEKITPLPDPLAGTSPGTHGSGTATCSGTGTCPGTGGMPGSQGHFRLEPLSPGRYRVEFDIPRGRSVPPRPPRASRLTSLRSGPRVPRASSRVSLGALRSAGAELANKIDRARELVSHALPSGDLAVLFERALDRLIEHETKRRLGSQRRQSKQRPLAPGSRHVPLEIAGQVWERDGGQCTFTDEHGRRCSERRFITLEHRHPFALGGPATVDNLCLLCSSHNHHTARQVFGEQHIAKKQAERRAHDRVLRALRGLGFRAKEAEAALAELARRGWNGERAGAAARGAVVARACRESLSAA